MNINFILSNKKLADKNLGLHNKYSDLNRLIVVLTHHRGWQRSWLGPGQEIQALMRATRPGLQEIIRI